MDRLFAASVINIPTLTMIEVASTVPILLVASPVFSKNNVRVLAISNGKVTTRKILIKIDEATDLECS